MLFDQATDAQMRAARIFAGATMVAFMAAPIFGQHSRIFRIVVTGLYVAGVLIFIAYVLP